MSGWQWISHSALVPDDPLLQRRRLMKWKHETVTISASDYASRKGIEILDKWGEKG